MYEPGYNDSYFGGTMLLVWFAVYLYYAYSQYKIAAKTGHDSPWWAFIPVLNVFQFIQMAQKPLWWFFACLIPIVNIIVIAWLWSEVAKACQKNPIWGVMMIIPFLNFIAIGYLAFSSPVSITPAPTPTPARQPEKVA
ncbi:MAG: hypothetical protein JW763_00690 [candidate division Zixibacteria bacterium]|nr:hypothetical protein [candidate division Zixibacteria bacterium]